MLLGLLSHREDWYIRSNAESGDGFSDILIEIEEAGIGIVIEVKYPNNGRKSEKSGESKRCGTGLSQSALCNLISRQVKTLSRINNFRIIRNTVVGTANLC
ncbi:MAG: hypothetical protein HFH91_09920 [Lachnospiraceae bacterium]|nr:hypothetical protein [Lachnospiraceae bacterium]